MPVRIGRAAAAVLFAAYALTGYAQTGRGDNAADYPNKPIRIVIGFTPGGGPDITARYLAQKLTEAWPRSRAHPLRGRRPRALDTHWTGA